MAKTREYMDYLDEHIGIAPANSQEELQAAELIADIMGDHGLEPVIEEFDSRPLAQAMPYVVGALLFVLMIVQGVTGGAVHVVTLVLSLVLAALIIVRQFAFDLFEGFGPAAGSQNVVAIHHAEGDKVVKGARPIVVVAHLDTPRESLLHGPMARMHAPLKQMFAPCAIVAVVSLVIQCLVFLPEPVRTFAWVIGVVSLVPVLVLSVVSIVDRHLPCTEGANDNKASIAALLSIMDRVRPSDDRVSAGEAGARPRRRSADETELPVQSSTHIEVIEDVKGVRHGEEILASLGILPATCEIVYEEPKVRIVEEQIEVNPFAEGFDEEDETTVEAPAAEAPAGDEEEAFSEDAGEGEPEVPETDESDAEEDDEVIEDEYEDADGGRLAGVAAVGTWFSDRFSSLRDRIAARRERALREGDDTEDEKESAGGRHARQEDSEWFDDEDESVDTNETHDDGERDYEDEGEYAGDAEDDEYYDDYEDAEDSEDEPYEDELAPLSADMVGSGRPSAPRRSTPALEWDDEEDEEEYADSEEEKYADDEEYDDEDSDRYYHDGDVVEDDYADDDYEDDGEYDEYEDEEDESDEFVDSDEDYETTDYDDEPQDEEGTDESDHAEQSRGDSDGDEWIDWEEDGAEPEAFDDQETSSDDSERQQGFPSRIKAFFRKHFSSQPRESENDEYLDDEYDDYEDDEYYEDRDGEAYEESERVADGEDFFDERDRESAPYDDEADDSEEAGEYQDEYAYADGDEQADKQDGGDLVGEPLADDYDDDYSDYEYDESDFDEQDSLDNMSAEPFNDYLSDPNELHFDREEDDDILPRDTTGLDTISDSYDLIETAPEPQHVDSPTPIDDPNWGVSSFTPARPAVNIARRAALFDLPDPNYATPDPLRPEDDYEDDYEEDYEGGDEYYDDYEDDAEPYDYEDEVQDGPDVDAARGDWKGGATMRSDLASDGDVVVADVETLKDAILELGDDFLVAHDIWFVVTGASAADHSGIKAFLDEHRRDVRGAFLVNLDSIGAGALGVYVREGLREARRADRRIVRMLKDVASDLHVQLETASMTWDETDAATPMRSRLRAVTLVGLDDTDQPALSHTREDVPDNVNPKQVYDVVRIVCELIRRS